MELIFLLYLGVLALAFWISFKLIKLAVKSAILEAHAELHPKSEDAPEAPPPIEK